MTRKYIVVDYNKGQSKEPTLAAEYTDQKEAESKFEELKTANKARSVVLFNAQTAEVEKIALLGEPIFLVEAIQFARTFVEDSSLLKEVVDKGLQVTAGAVISAIAAAIAGGPLPGVGGVILGHFIAPYHAIKGDAVNTVRSTVGMMGGFNGALIGFLAGGPVGAIVGGIIGGAALGGGAGALVKYGTEHPKCKNCSGTGMVGYYDVCQECRGYGYRK